MIKIYKDIVFWSIAIIWLMGNLIEYKLTNYCYIVSFVMIAVMAVLNSVKIYNDRFNEWLNTPIKKKI